MKSARLGWIDYARGIAISLVCYRHVFEGSKEAGIPVNDYSFLEHFNILLYSFRMPLFFIISGLFFAKSFQKKGLKLYVESRARTILYPYFLWGVIQFSLQILFTKYTNYHPTTSSYLNLLYLPRECAQFWYLYALFNVSVIYSFVKFFLKLSPVHNLVIGVIFFYGSSLIYQQNINAGFLFDILHYYVFFSIGDFLGKILLNKENYRYLESGKFLLWIMIPFGIGQVYFLLENLNHDTPKYMHVEFYQPFIFLLIALVGCFFIISLTFYLQKKDSLKWLKVLGRHSLYIYVAHVIVFAFTRIVLNKLFGIQNVAVIIITGMVSGILGPILMYKIAERLNIRWIFTLEKNESYGNNKPLGDTSINQVQRIKN